MAKESIPAPVVETTSEAPKKGGKGKLFTMLLIPLILIPGAGGAFLAYRLFGPHEPATEETAAHGEGSTDKKEKEKKEAKEGEQGEFMQIQSMVINPAGTSGQRFLMVSIGLECVAPEAMEELKAKEVVVRDVILKTLSERSVEELASINLRSQIKEKLRLAINAELSSGVVDRLYFTEYVLQ